MHDVQALKFRQMRRRKALLKQSAEERKLGEDLEVAVVFSNAFRYIPSVEGSWSEATCKLRLTLQQHTTLLI